LMVKCLADRNPWRASCVVLRIVVADRCQQAECSPLGRYLCDLKLTVTDEAKELPATAGHFVALCVGPQDPALTELLRSGLLDQ